MQIDVVILPLMLLLGLAAAAFGVIYVICQIVRVMGRGIRFLFASPRQDFPKSHAKVRRFRICSQRYCRKMEYRDAIYCSQCGARLSETASVSGVRYE